MCHIKARSPEGPRYDPAQTSEMRHGYDNLILMCARHGRLIDADTTAYSVELLYAMKAAQEKKCGSVEISQADVMKTDALLAGYRVAYNISAGGHVMLNSAGAIQATNVTIKNNRRSVKLLPAEGSLGANVLHRNYVKHLIDRYNEFASKQPGRAFSHGVVYRLIKSRFKADWERIPLARFDDLVRYLSSRIDGTQLGRINRSRGYKNYSTFEDYGRQYADDVEAPGPDMALN